MTKEKTHSYSAFYNERRQQTRYVTDLDVNYTHEDTYLFTKFTNVSEMGIFIASKTPLSIGSLLDLTFNTGRNSKNIKAKGEVMWIDQGGHNSEMGMGVKFINPSEETKSRIKALIQTIAYLD